MMWKKGPIIGRGSSATVSLATTVAGDIFALKSTNLSTSSLLQKEQQFLSKLKSPYIIKYIGFDIGYDDHVPMYNLFMEYAPGGTISDVIKKQGGFLDECLIKSYAHQILLGLDYLHSNNLVHCDVKCDNILVCEDGVKIGDLGCARWAENVEDDVTAVFSGTPVFMAPEVARGEKQGFAADVWAFGCAVIEMATGSNPWPEINDPVSGLYRIGYSGDVPLLPARLSEEAKGFLKKCFQRNDEERWSVKQLLQHPFVNSNKITENLSKSSPSSILDQGFWDSFEVTDSPDPIKFVPFSGEAPVDRIKQLVEVEAPTLMNSSMPKWVDEEDWITVRCNQVDEDSKASHDADMEDYDSESTRSESESISELYEQEGFSISVRIVVEYSELETSVASIVGSRFLGFNNIINDICNLLFNSNLNFTLFAFHIQVNEVNY
ncbi:hypothetical protein R6Q57_009160 [Mikania cordata]